MSSHARAEARAERFRAFRSRTLAFLILGQSVHVDCTDAGLREMVLANYEAMRAAAGGRPPDLRYTLARDPRSRGFLLCRPGQAAVGCADLSALLFLLEKDITVALQHRRPDLLFLHAAALEQGGKAWLLAGESGHGKSTTAWGLLHHGFGYLSDELSPVDLGSLRVLAYPHALCLKRPPPPAYALPRRGVLDLGATLHVPVRALPQAAANGPHDLAALLFVCYRADLKEPALQPIGPAQAGARLYAATLNALAHPGCGLDAVVYLAERVPAFVLHCADLAATCDIVSRQAQACEPPSIMGHGPSFSVQCPPRLRARRAARRRLVFARAR